MPGGKTRETRGPGWRGRRRAKEAKEAEEAIDPSQLDDGQMIVSGPDGDKVVDVESIDGKPPTGKKWGPNWSKRAIVVTITIGLTVFTFIRVLPESNDKSGTTVSAPSTTQPAPTTNTAVTVAAIETSEGFVAALIDCPPRTKQDATGRRPSPKPGEEVKEVAEIAAVTATDGAFNLLCSGFFFGSYVFTMIVEGDAETEFVAEGTTFDLRFVVNSTWPQNVFEDDSGFTVFVDWNRPAGVYVGSVNDSNSTRIEGATVDIVWLDPSTLEATVTLPGGDVDVRNVRTELSGLTQDAQERTIAQYFDVAIWNATP